MAADLDQLAIRRVIALSWADGWRYQVLASSHRNRPNLPPRVRLDNYDETITLSLQTRRGSRIVRR